MRSLGHVLWVGGAPGSGKTTIASRLARRHGLRLYSADTRTWAHRDRALAAGNQAAYLWESLAPEARGDAPSEQLLAMSLHRERGPMVLDDLRALPTTPLVVAEGSTLPASAISAGIAEPTRAVWLIPTHSFQTAQLEARRTPAGATKLYLLLADVTEREANEHAAPILTINGSKGIDDTTNAVEALFEGALAEGPRAETLAERCSLLREANEAIVAQVRGYYTRPWAEGDPDVVIRTFVCECGDTGCEASVELPVGFASAEPALALGHG